MPHLSRNTPKPKNTKKENNASKKINTKNSSPIRYIRDPKMVSKNFPEFSYEGGDGFKSVRFTLDKNESIRANGGGMNYMSSKIEITTEMGTVLNSIKRKLSGSTLFYNTFTNKSNTKEVIQFSGVTPGNVSCFYIPKGKKLKVTFDNYLASTPNLKISGRASFGGVITGYGLFYTTIEAEESDGLVWLTSFGNTIEVTIKPEDTMQFDNGILLALDDEIPFETGLLGGVKSFFFSSEGIITKVHNTTTKPLTIYLQSRSKLAYTDYIRYLVESQILVLAAQGTILNSVIDSGSNGKNAKNIPNSNNVPNGSVGNNAGNGDSWSEWF